MADILYICYCPSYNRCSLEDHGVCHRREPHVHTSTSECKGGTGRCAYSKMSNSETQCVVYDEIPLEELEYMVRLGIR
jgi:hypothetical protein